MEGEQKVAAARQRISAPCTPRRQARRCANAAASCRGAGHGSCWPGRQLWLAGARAPAPAATPQPKCLQQSLFPLPFCPHQEAIGRPPRIPFEIGGRVEPRPLPDVGRPPCELPAHERSEFQEALSDALAAPCHGAELVRTVQEATGRTWQVLKRRGNGGKGIYYRVTDPDGYAHRTLRDAKLAAGLRTYPPLWPAQTTVLLHTAATRAHTPTLPVHRLAKRIRRRPRSSGWGHGQWRYHQDGVPARPALAALMGRRAVPGQLPPLGGCTTRRKPPPLPTPSPPSARPPPPNRPPQH